jgi:RNA polymerase sigma factor (sigma-70 family)
VLFYLARWCQKKARSLEPDLASFDDATLQDTAESIARHLADDGARVDRLLTNDSSQEWTDLRRQLFASACSRVPEAAAYEVAEEALSKIAEVLIVGTPPSQATAGLAAGPDGPTNEYVFDSPFSLWARKIVVNLIKDEWRREARRPAVVEARKASDPGRELVESARAALPELLQAIRELPPKQREVLILSLERRDLDAAVRARLRRLAPDLFPTAGPPVSTDADIAERLGSIPRRVTANRSAARRKLARRNATWALLLDLMLPHRSTRPLHVEGEA